MELEEEPQEIELDIISDFIETVSTVPDYVPRSFADQFRIYKSGSTRRFYWYDTENNEWVYVSGSV